MTTHPVKAAGGRRSHVQAFEAIATGQPPRCAARTLEWLEWNGMIEKRFRIGKDCTSLADRRERQDAPRDGAKGA